MIVCAFGGERQVCRKMWECEICETLVPYGSELHYLTKEHVKRAMHGLRGFCVACSIELPSPCAVKLHLQQKKHLNRVKQGYHISCLSEYGGWACQPCGLQFSKRLGWEVHLASSIHQGSLSSGEFSSSVEILAGYLSAGPISASCLEVRPVCRLCDESCEALGELVFHLLSQKHEQHLKQCMCPGCGKHFSIVELPSHLRSKEHLEVLKSRTATDGSKYKLAIQRQSGDTRAHDSQTDKVQREVNPAEFSSGCWPPIDPVHSAGFEGWWYCSHCLIACRSWLGFSVHVQDKLHEDNIPRMWTVALGDGVTEFLTFDRRMIACRRLQLQVRITQSCSLSTASAWQSWKEQKPFYSGWCHACGVMLHTPHLVEHHLANHVSGTEKEHSGLLPTNGLEPSLKRARVSQGFADIFECRICSVSFCNHLGLHFHIALEQHQLRCSTFGSQEISAGGWCECCGVTASHHALPDRTSDLGEAGPGAQGRNPPPWSCANLVREAFNMKWATV